jgi:anti-sigma factor RsiW
MFIGPQARKRRVPKRRFEMSSKSPFSRTLIAIAAALAMSTIAVGAAVGPAQADANPLQVSVNA